MMPNSEHITRMNEHGQIVIIISVIIIAMSFRVHYWSCLPPPSAVLIDFGVGHKFQVEYLAPGSSP
jgi:hypothetical protein